jgi:hypothetical protein
MRIQQTIIALGLLSLVSIANAASPTKTDAEQSLSKAQLLWTQSIEAGHGWNTVKPFIDEAKQALKAGNYSEAISLADKGAMQAKLSLTQAEHEKTNWVHNLPK